MDNSGIWDLDIYEIKIGGVKDGLSFRLNQVITKFVNGRDKAPIKRRVSDIVRRVIDNEIQYQVYTRCLEDDDDLQVEKVSIGNSIYLTMKTRVGEDI